MAENNAQEIKAQKINTQEASHPVTVRMSKLTEGIGILFSGVLTMLEALDPNTAQALVEDFVHTDEAAPVESGTQEEAKEADAPATPSAPAAPVDTAPTTASTAAEKKGRGKANKKEPAAEAPVAEAPQPEQAKPAAAPSVTVDDVARIVVQKVKANQGINDKIRALVNAYGAPRVTELKPEVLEAFLTDLAQL